MGLFNGLVEWTNNVFGSMGSYGLFLLAFMESSFFPVPPDVLLIALALADPSKALWLAFVCTAGSVIGGMFGYLIGRIGEIEILERLVSHKKIEKVHNLFNKYEALAILIAGFTPVPYKVFTIAGGVFYINFKKFVLMSIISRGARFYIEAVLILFYGAEIMSFIDKYFNWTTILITIGIIMIYFLYRRFKKKRAV